MPISNEVMMATARKAYRGMNVVPRTGGLAYLEHKGKSNQRWCACVLGAYLLGAGLTTEYSQIDKSDEWIDGCIRGFDTDHPVQIRLRDDTQALDGWNFGRAARQEFRPVN